MIRVRQIIYKDGHLLLIVLGDTDCCVLLWIQAFWKENTSFNEHDDSSTSYCYRNRPLCFDAVDRISLSFSLVQIFFVSSSSAVPDIGPGSSFSERLIKSKTSVEQELRRKKTIRGMFRWTMTVIGVQLFWKTQPSGRFFVPKHPHVQLACPLSMSSLTVSTKQKTSLIQPGPVWSSLIRSGPVWSSHIQRHPAVS